LRDLSPSRRSLGSYAVGEILLYLYVPMFPWKDFLSDGSAKLKNTRKGTDNENSKKQGKNGGKKKKRFLHVWRFPYSCVLDWSGTASDYHPHGTLPHENPLGWEPPLQHN